MPGKIWKIVTGLAVVAVAGLGAVIGVCHVRSVPELRESLAMLAHGRTQVFTPTQPPPRPEASVSYRIDVLRRDDRIETRHVVFAGMDSERDQPMAPGAMKIYAHRQLGEVSVAVESEAYLIRHGKNLYDSIYEYGAVFDPHDLPDAYVGSLRDHAVAWNRQDGTKLHETARPDAYFQALSGCAQTPFSPPEENSLGEARVLIKEGRETPDGELPAFAAGTRRFYMMEPDDRACEQGGDGDAWNPCSDILPFHPAFSAYSSGRCPAEGVPLLDTCALVGELLLCNLDDVAAIRVRRDDDRDEGDIQNKGAENIPVFFIAADRLDGSVVLPPVSAGEAYVKALDAATPARMARALAIQKRFGA